MNALAHLLEHEQYAQWVGRDSILDAILPDSPRRDPLDVGVLGKDLRLCRTLAEVQDRLITRTSADPVFVYALPQDIHVSAITREGGAAVDTLSYPDLYAPVASRVRRLDACFGTFVSTLKKLGLYDDSLIVLTSDHGDSLGEDGRMGHAYTIYPEVMRIPLVVHLPTSMRARWASDVTRPAYSTDITPTIYRLLGHDLQPPAPFFGEALVFPVGHPPPPARDRMVAASYGSVYGAVLQGGRELYIVDAMQLRKMSFSLGRGPEPGHAITTDATQRPQASP